MLVVSTAERRKVAIVWLLGHLGKHKIGMVARRLGYCAVSVHVVRRRLCCDQRLVKAAIPTLVRVLVVAAAGCSGELSADKVTLVARLRLVVRDDSGTGRWLQLANALLLLLSLAVLMVLNDRLQDEGDILRVQVVLDHVLELGRLLGVLLQQRLHLW